MSSSVEKIKERVGIVEVISSYIKVEKAGANYKAKCPFHNEKTASFFISPDRGSYYCFGCGAKGDIFTFVQEFEGVEFMQALSLLALKAGVELVPEKKGEKDHKQKLFGVLEDATEFFAAELKKNTEVLAYLKGRGVSEKIIEDWQIGFAPNEWRKLFDHLLGKGGNDQKGESVKAMLSTGLIKKNDKASGEPFYDTFRGRIMFPLFDQSGRVVGFSGRIFGAADDGKSPKYLNSPETELFNKSDFLYGLDKAKMAIRKQDYSIVVEGQFDLIMSHQAGFLNTVASSGTAFSERHIKRLQSLSNRIMFAFDGDSAGFTATERSVRLSLLLGLEVKVAPLPKGDDPASLIQKNPKAWSHIVSKSEHIINYTLNYILASNKDTKTIDKLVEEKVLPLVLLVPSEIERQRFIKKIAEETNMREESVWDRMKIMAKTAAQEKGNLYINYAAPPPSKHSVSRSILGIIFWQEHLKNPVVNLSEMTKRLEASMGTEKLNDLKKNLEPEKEKLIFETEQYYKESEKLEIHIEELFTRLEEENLKEELAKAIVTLKKAEQMKDATLIEALTKHCQDISAKLGALKQKI